MFAEPLSAGRRWCWEQNSHAPLKNADKLVEAPGQISPSPVNNAIILFGYRVSVATASFRKLISEVPGIMQTDVITSGHNYVKLGVKTFLGSVLKQP